MSGMCLVANNFPEERGSNAPADKKPARKRAKRAPRTSPTKQVQPQTSENIANAQTVEQLALRRWAAEVGSNVLTSMSTLMDELLQSYLLDDDDEETDDGQRDDHHQREKKLLDEAITSGLDKFPDFNAANDLPLNSDPDIARVAAQLRDALTKCLIGATTFEERFPRAQLERMVKRDLKASFKKDPRYSKHVREDVPGSDVKKYSRWGRTTSKGTFVKASNYENDGGLDALFTGGWRRVAKDRIDPEALSYRFGYPRKSEQQSWRHHYLITERSGKQSRFELPREKLVGLSAIGLLMKAGVRVIAHPDAHKALVRFLGFHPKREILRMPHVGWAEVGSHWIFVRPDEVLVPPGMPQASTTYILDTTATQHGLHVAGTAAEWVSRRAASRQFQCRAVTWNILCGAVVAVRERTRWRQSSSWVVNHRQNADVRCRPVDLRLAARDLRRRFWCVMGWIRGWF